MSDLNDLISVINCLTTVENKYVLKLIRIGKVDEEQNLTLKLYNLILNKKSSENEMQESIYGKINRTAFNKLVYRLMEKILDILILKDHIEANFIYDKRAQDIFLLERQMIISEILRFRGLFKLSMQRLDKVIARSIYYEHYHILNYILEKKKRWMFHEINEKELAKQNILIEHYEIEKNNQGIALDIYMKIFKIDHDSFNEKENRNIKYNLAKLNKIASNSESKNILFYTYYSKLQSYILNEQYERGLICVEEIIDFLFEHRNIYTRTRYGNAILNKGILNRSMFKFESAIQFIGDSKKYLSDQKQNNIIYYEQLFLTNFYLGDINKIKYYYNLLNKELTEKKIDNNSDIKFKYYSAVICFILKDFKEVISCLGANDNITKPNYLNIQVKVLQIINFIELMKFDLADNKIENLRKYVSRNYRFKSINQNMDVIKLLLQLSKRSYNYKETFEKEKDLIEKIFLRLRQFRFYNTEMIIFHEWFLSKVEGKPYDHVNVMKKLKKLNKK